jgi:histidine triad (HIT) family protein
MPAGCVFDQIRDGTVPAHIVADEPDFLAFLDVRPVFPGHTLIMPRRHVATLGELPEHLVGALFGQGRRVAQAMRPALGAHGAFLALNDEVSQSVAHVHLHVVPRRRKDGLRGFFWPRQAYADDGQAEGFADALRQALAGLPRPVP